jgi:hypothetical protein
MLMRTDAYRDFDRPTRRIQIDIRDDQRAVNA